MQLLGRVMTAFAALAAVSMATPALAQTAQNQPNTGLGFGVLGGLTYTSVQTETNLFDVQTDSGAGYMFGIWFGGNRDGRAGLMGELSYVTKKIKATEDGEEFSQKLTYVELPVLLRINVGSRERDRPSAYFLAGPVFDIQIKSELEGADTPDDFYEGLDIGAMVGVGFEVVRIGVEGRYSWGLRSVLGTDAAVDTGFGSTKQNTLQVLLKVRIN